MKAIVNREKRRYVERLAVPLVLIVLVAGGGMCSQTVTIEVSPANAGTTTPSGTVSVARASEIEIEATAGAGYEFERWTTSFPVSWLAGYSATHNPSKFQVPATDVTVTANFRQPGSLSLSQTTAACGPGSATGQPQDDWQEFRPPIVD